jgi:hypothetical protein
MPQRFSAIKALLAHRAVRAVDFDAAVLMGPARIEAWIEQRRTCIGLALATERSRTAPKPTVRCKLLAFTKGMRLMRERVTDARPDSGKRIQP